MDIKSYLRDMDREEEELRGQIMRIQVRIAQLHDTRLLLMNREEERAQRAGLASPFGMLPGEIVVRDPVKMPAQAPAPMALAAPQQVRQAAPALANVPATPVVRPHGLPLSHRDHRLGRSSILQLLTDHGPLPKVEIIRLLGGVNGPLEADKLSKTLSNMRQHEAITLENGVYAAVGTKKRKSRKGVKIAAPDPERAAAERQTVLDVLRQAGGPMPSGDVMKAAMAGSKSKNQRDRLYWALKRLRTDGRVIFRDGLYTAAAA